MLKSPDAVARATVFTPEVADRSMYEAWCASKDVSTGQPAEMVIAWKLAKIIHERPGAVIRALRGQVMTGKQGLVPRVDRIVEANASITFQVDDGGVRRAVFVEQQ